MDFAVVVPTWRIEKEDWDRLEEESDEYIRTHYGGSKV